eukprot:2187215-Rhodomonas_salina.5
MSSTVTVCVQYGHSIWCSATSLRACYALSGTDLAHAAGSTALAQVVGSEPAEPRRAHSPRDHP